MTGLKVPEFGQSTVALDGESLAEWGESEMTKITVYDIEAEELAKIADVNDITIAEVVEMLMEYAEEVKENNNLK